jgi:hypothetical protein
MYQDAVSAAAAPRAISVAFSAPYCAAAGRAASFE